MKEGYLHDRLGAKDRPPHESTSHRQCATFRWSPGGSPAVGSEVRHTDQYRSQLRIVSAWTTRGREPICLGLTFGRDLREPVRPTRGRQRLEHLAERRAHLARESWAVRPRADRLYDPPTPTPTSVPARRRREGQDPHRGKTLAGSCTGTSTVRLEQQRRPHRAAEGRRQPEGRQALPLRDRDLGVVLKRGTPGATTPPSPL